MGEHDVNQEALDKYSLRGRVFQKLREDILNGRYQANDELKESAIGEELGVSRTPVREAFRQLELEGLIRIVPNKGAYRVFFGCRHFSQANEFLQSHGIEPIDWQIENI